MQVNIIYLISHPVSWSWIFSNVSRILGPSQLHEFYNRLRSNPKACDLTASLSAPQPHMSWELLSSWGQKLKFPSLWDPQLHLSFSDPPVSPTTVFQPGPFPGWYIPDSSRIFQTFTDVPTMLGDTRATPPPLLLPRIETPGQFYICVWCCQESLTAWVSFKT